MSLNDILNRKDVPDDVKAELAIMVKDRELSEIAVKLKEILQHAPVGILMAAPGGKMLYINPEGERIFELKQEALTQIDKWYEKLFFGGDALKTADEAWRNDVAVGSGQRAFKVWTGSGKEKIVDFRIQRIEEVVYVSLLDITERKTAESKLFESEKKYHAIIETTRTGYVMLNRAGRVVEANSIYVRLSGHSDLKEIIGRSPAEWTARPDMERAAKAIELAWQQGSIRNLELNYIGEEGRLTPVDFHATVLGMADNPTLIALCRDISERKDLEKKIVEAQKMDSIGNLAGGIAHDFNNMLMGILGCASLLDMDETDPEKKGYIEEISAAARKAAELTQKLLSFSRRSAPDIQNINFNGLVMEAVGIIKRSADKTVRIDTRLDKDLSSVNGDPAQLSQVIMNLCVNAIEAMPGGGDLILQTHNVTFDESISRAYPHALPGQYVLLTVTDTGIGMDEEVQEKLFEPFFTTKISGDKKGTGFGLATVYGIVTRHGGVINFFSKIGEGAVFKVYLPAAFNPLEERVELPGAVTRGKGTVLVVDDEDSVRNTIQTMLHKLGYQVIPARDGVEAVELYQKKFKDIDLVVFDMIMPNMSGKEAYLLLKEINPGIKSILATGYDRDGRVQELLRLGVNGFLHKPFRIVDIFQKLKDILAPE